MHFGMLMGTHIAICPFCLLEFEKNGVFFETECQGKSPSFPHLLLLLEGTFEKADCGNSACWPDPWQRLILAAAKHCVRFQDQRRFNSTSPCSAGALL